MAPTGFPFLADLRQNRLFDACAGVAPVSAVVQSKEEVVLEEDHGLWGCALHPDEGDDLEGNRGSVPSLVMISPGEVLCRILCELRSCVVR